MDQFQYSKEQGLFSLYIYIESFKKKAFDWFQYNLAGMFLWWPSTTIVQAVLIHQKKHGC